MASTLVTASKRTANRPIKFLVRARNSNKETRMFNLTQVVRDWVTMPTEPVRLQTRSDQ